MVTPTPTTVQVKFQLRLDTSANWSSVNPVLLAGEMGLETNTNRIKIGNGSTAWNSLGYFPFAVSGGTVTGNLEIGTTGTLTFEGSSADNFETTLGVVNPTADRTINLPNVSGTIITTGDSGTVTSTMIADGTIVNADINASAAIAHSKLATITAGYVLIGNASNVPTATQVTGDVTISDTGVTAISSGVIVDADVSATAEIAVSKLANGTANQVIVTDGTNVSWSDNLTLAGDLTVNGTTTTVNSETLLVKDKNIEMGVVDTPTDSTADGGGITLKGATDKTINWIDATDAWTSSERFSVPLGSAASPSLTFTGDENSGVYSPGADQVAVATNGTGRLFVDASGNVQIKEHSNTVSTGASLYLFDTSGAISSGTSSGRICFYSSDSTDGASIRSEISNFYENSSADSALLFKTYNGTLSERLRITSAGLVGIGTSSPGALLHVQGGTENAIIGSSTRKVYFRADSGGIALATGAVQTGTGIYLSEASNFVSAQTDSIERLRVTSTGVGIGTTSPSAELHVNPGSGNAGNVRIDNGTGSSADGYLNVEVNSGGALYETVKTGGLAHVWYNTGAERMRIDTAGRLLVGTSSARANLFNSTIAPAIQLEGAGIVPAQRFLSVINNYATAGDGGGVIVLGRSKGGTVGSNTYVVTNDQLGRFDFQGNDGTEFVTGASIEGYVDGITGANLMPSRLVFSTTAAGASSPTPRMTIYSNGKVAIGGDLGSLLSVDSNNLYPLVVRLTAQPATYPLGTWHHAATTGNNVFHLFATEVAGTTRGSISYNRGAGLVAYNTTSDYRAKTILGPVSSPGETLDALKVYRGVMRDAVIERPMLIAHEAQEVAPYCVTGEKDAVDDNSEPIYQQMDLQSLVPLLIAEVQQLRQRVAALETP